MKNQFKKYTIKNCGIDFCMIVFFFALVAVMPLKANADFIDDFEDGAASGWHQTILDGVNNSAQLLNSASNSALFGVEMHNESYMAFIYHMGSGLNSLSHDFDYFDDSMVSFDMQATANGDESHPSSTGVEISFLNYLNSTLGSITIENAANPTKQPDEYVKVNSQQHHYDILISELVALAGLTGSDPITKISLNFYASASSYLGSNSSATVWFDNVSISSVPIPGAVWLLGSGIIGMVGLRRRS